MSKIYVYFNSHYEDYGDIFTNALQKLRENSSHNVIGLILLSLTYRYGKMVTNIPAFTLENEHCIALSKLAVQFQLYIKKCPDQLIPVLKMGINYSLSNESNFAFLHFLKCFTSPLSNEDKKLILHYFNENVPQENNNHEAFLSFTAYLKKKVQEKPPAKEKSQSFMSDTTTVTSILVSDSDDLDDIDTEYAISDFSDG